MNEDDSKAFVPEGIVRIAPPSICDPDVILGYPTGRKIGSLDLTIGQDAKIRSGTVIYQGSRIGDNLETGHNVVIREENEIGDHFTVWSNSVIDYGCRIGNGVTIHCNVYIPQFTIIEDGVTIAPGSSFANDFHPTCPDFRPCMRGPVLKERVKIGVNVTILPKVTIGKYSLIGAGSVVSQDIPPYSVAYGNPARVSKNIAELKCKSGRREYPYRDAEEGNGISDESRIQRGRRAAIK